MAKTVVIYAGGNTEYQFPFDYLRKEFVKVSLVAADGTPTDKVYGSDYTVTDRKITLKVASDATGNVRIWRSTTTNPITVFSDASVLRARTLNALDTQLLHIAEENSDAISMYGMSFDKADNTWQGMGRIIKNVKNPLNPQDAVTLNYLDSVGVARGTQMEALAAQITADKSNSEVAAAAALVSEKNAKTSETNAKVSEMASKTSETNAKTSEENSKTSETNAKTSEENSKTSETNAKTSEENSKTSETNAKVYMEACSNDAGYTKVEMDALLKKKGGVPIGTITARLSKKPEAGELALDTGALVSRATYPDLWAWVQANAPLLSEADWQTQAAVQTSVGAYSTGDGSTTFRLPRLLDYMRGGAAADVGKWQGDAIRNIAGNVGILDDEAVGATSAPFIKTIGGSLNYTAGSGASSIVKFDASTQVPTADENRPKTIKVLYCVKAFDAETNPGLVDLTALANDVAGKVDKTTYAADFAKNISGNGYQKLPTGLIIQWAYGSFSTANDALQTITLPITFPNGILTAVVGTEANSAAIDDTWYTCHSKTNSTITVQRCSTNNGGSNVKPSVIAIGY